MNRMKQLPGVAKRVPSGVRRPASKTSAQRMGSGTGGARVPSAAKRQTSQSKTFVGDLAVTGSAAGKPPSAQNNLGKAVAIQKGEEVKQSDMTAAAQPSTDNDD